MSRLVVGIRGLMPLGSATLTENAQTADLTVGLISCR
jgi:hypothetical protein